MCSQIKIARKLAGVKRGTVHGLRHTFVTTMADSGIPAFQLMKIVGHADVETTQAYYHADTDVQSLYRLGCLAAPHPEGSPAWAVIAEPICERARPLRRDDREHVYFGLTRKETGVITSQPGEVPDFYVEARDSAVRLLANEPPDSILRDYRKWFLKQSEGHLLREKESAEEDHRG